MYTITDEDIAGLIAYFNGKLETESLSTDGVVMLDETFARNTLTINALMELQSWRLAKKEMEKSLLNLLTPLPRSPAVSRLISIRRWFTSAVCPRSAAGRIGAG